VNTLPFKVLPTDRTFVSGTRAESSDRCSRCGQPAGNAPLMLLPKSGQYRLQYCDRCTGFTSSDIDDDDWMEGCE
jgi:hypothetical protein